MAKEEKKVESLDARIARILYRLEAKKSNFNAFGKFSFRSAEAIYESLKPHLEAEGLNAKFDESISGEVFICTLIIRDSEGNEDRTTFNSLIDTDLKGMSKPQACGACASYCRKYVLCSRFLIDGGDHDLDDRNQKDDVADSIQRCTTLDELAQAYRRQQTFIDQNPDLLQLCSDKKALIKQGSQN